MIYHTYCCLKDILIVIWVQRLLHWGNPKIQTKLPQFLTLFFFSLLLKYGSCLVTKSLLTLTTPWTIARQVPLFIGFSRQAYWSSLHFLLQRIFPIQGSNLCLLHCRQILYQLSHQGKVLSKSRFLQFLHNGSSKTILNFKCDFHKNTKIYLNKL